MQLCNLGHSSVFKKHSIRDQFFVSSIFIKIQFTNTKSWQQTKFRIVVDITYKYLCIKSIILNKRKLLTLECYLFYSQTKELSNKYLRISLKFDLYSNLISIGLVSVYLLSVYSLPEVKTVVNEETPETDRFCVGRENNF